MTAPGRQHASVRVAVVGGGLAGLAAAAALSERGFRVELFEARRRLGGRAGSFRDPVSGRLVDSCRHVAMGCCTNLADFCRKTGVAHWFGRQRRLDFIGPDRRRYQFSSAPLLPAPLHLVPALMRLWYLGLADRVRVIRTMGRLARLPDDSHADQQTAAAWLRRQGERERAIRWFWSVILTSALGETPDRVSLAAARQVMVDGFLASRRAYELVVPQIPVGEICDRHMAGWLSQRAVTLHRGTRIRRIEGEGRRAHAVVLPDGSRVPFDFFVVAVPWWNVRALFPAAMPPDGRRLPCDQRASDSEGPSGRRNAPPSSASSVVSLLNTEATEVGGPLPTLQGAERLEPSPITAVHLWLDRPITSLPNAVLVGRLGQWVFGPPLPCRRKGSRQCANARRSPSRGHLARESTYHYQIVISASRALKGRRKEDVVAQLRKELSAIWPAARRARVLRWGMVTHTRAVFSFRPGVGRFRPPQVTGIPNLALAGDWTATGWPATMEGAVRSGYLAAEAILNRTSRKTSGRLLAPDLPRGRLARWMLAGETDE